MSLLDRDGASADALLTDLYLDALLAGAVLRAAAVDDHAMAGPDLDPAARFAADRLRHDLVRVHPSFRFEERLATRLAEAAVTMRMPAAAGAEGRVVPFRAAVPVGEAEPDSDAGADARARDLARPLIIGGALTSAALSLAGAALVAWRRGRPGTAAAAMGRAARAAHAAGGATARRRSRRSSRRLSVSPRGRGPH